MDDEPDQVLYEELVLSCTSDLRSILGQLHRIGERKDFNGYAIEDFQEIAVISSAITYLKEKVGEILQREIRNTGSGYDEYLAERYGVDGE